MQKTNTKKMHRTFSVLLLLLFLQIAAARCSFSGQKHLDAFALNNFF